MTLANPSPHFLPQGQPLSLQSSFAAVELDTHAVILGRAPTTAPFLPTVL